MIRISEVKRIAPIPVPFGWMEDGSPLFLNPLIELVDTLRRVHQEPKMVEKLSLALLVLRYLARRNLVKRKVVHPRTEV